MDGLLQLCFMVTYIGAQMKYQVVHIKDLRNITQSLSIWGDKFYSIF